MQALFNSHSHQLVKLYAAALSEANVSFARGYQLMDEFTQVLHDFESNTMSNEAVDRLLRSRKYD